MSLAASDALKAAVMASHTPLLRADVLHAGVPVLSTTAASLTQSFTSLSGSVKIDGKAAVRRSFDLSVVDKYKNLLPLTAGDLLDPITGNEIQMFRGVRLSTGDEFISQGIFGLEQVNLDEEDSGVALDLSGRDRAAAVSNNHWRTPYTIAKTTNVGTAIQNLISNRLTTVGTLTFQFEATTQTVLEDMSLDGSSRNDPWLDAVDLATGIGMELFWDNNGVCVMRTPPDPATLTPAWSFLRGTSNLRTNPLNRKIDKTTLVNGVIVNSSASWLVTPIGASVWDDDPASPINRSLIGEFPKIIDDATVFSTAAAALAAAAQYTLYHGVEEEIDWNGVPLPFLDAGDPIIVDADVLGGSKRLVIETLTMPWDAETSMSGTTRRRRV